MDKQLSKIKDRILALRDIHEPPDVSFALLQSVAEIFERSITFIVRPKELIGERALGVHAERDRGPASAARLKIPLTRPSVFCDVIEKGQFFYGESDDEVLKEHLFAGIGAPLRPTIILLPMKSRGKIMTLTYGDFGRKEVRRYKVMCCILANQAGLVVENALYRNCSIRVSQDSLNTDMPLFTSRKEKTMDIATFTQILEIAFKKKVSDIHFEVDNRPIFRARGHLIRSKLNILTKNDTEFIASTVMEQNNRKLPENLTEFDTSYTLSNVGRFRVSIFRQRGYIGIVMRVIPHYIGTFEELNLPAVLGNIVKVPNGLILVCGPTGNGKSTTLASMIRFVNDNFDYNVVTIEDPIEFIFPSNQSCIIQRELGIDTESFGGALKAAMRMDPDVIMVGELRDLETIDACIKAAETGHLVLSTFHTQMRLPPLTALWGISPQRQENVRHRLADSSWLRFLYDSRGKSGEQILPALEVMYATSTIKACIREGQLDEIEHYIEKGRDEYQMQTLDQHLIQLCKQDIITLDEAKRLSRATDLERKLMYY
jgi:twitching motility protein PilT